MGIFSRIGDILSSNINSMLDKAEDPEKIARLMIQEMEDTLVEVRTAAARSIADKKALYRELETLQADTAEWERKAELAVTKGRDDLARGALVEKQHLVRQREAMEKEMAQVEEAISKANSDMQKLQAKLDEAKARHKALMMRKDAAVSRIRMREQEADGRVDDALARYARVERRVDQLEAEAESYDLGARKPSLERELADLEASDHIEDELSALKKRLDNSKAATSTSEAPSV